MPQLCIHSIQTDMKRFLKFSPSLSPQVSPDQGSFEGRVVVVCEKMMSQPCWASSTQLVHSKNSRGMTLLHLAAAQGYAGLIQTLIRWR